jgi:hypothetical protein
LFAGKLFREHCRHYRLEQMMKAYDASSVLIRGVLVVLLTAGMAFGQSAVIWNGPTISFTHTDQNNAVDQITPGVGITRSSGGGGLYNAVTEGGATPGVSPEDTEWAIGDLSDATNLSYTPCILEAGHSPAQYIGTTFVVHLINENIYLALTLTDWEGQNGAPGKTFSYTRTTAPPPPSPTPTVTITNPASGAIFAAPASLHLGATPSVSTGTVTNVQFFANSTNSLGSVGTAPFTLTSGALAAGAYSLTAVATAAGVSGTSPSVNVTVVTPVTTILTNAKTNAGQFSFNYTATPGLTYVVYSSSSVTGGWVPVKTNTPVGSSVHFTAPISAGGAAFYRVGRQPNP